jgi:hypothetical protein
MTTESGAAGTRTPGLFHAMESLYHLSYSPITVDGGYQLLFVWDWAAGVAVVPPT